MNTCYSNEKNLQILLSLMKAHGVKRVVISPGGTNICFVGSVQQDPDFELYSCVDERSAAYMACGIAAETGEPVAISCTGATAARNYIPALTEAYYRKLPVLAITSTRPIEEIGHHIPQVTDRTQPLRDIVNTSVYLPEVRSEADEWNCTVCANKALLELRHRGGGPVHINLMTTYSEDFSVKKLPEARVIRRAEYGDALPDIPQGKTAIFAGAHLKWDKRLTDAVDTFCERYNAAVICDHTSNYKGRYGIMGSLILNQIQCPTARRRVDTLIHIGEISGAYMNIYPQHVWRVNPDGELRDTFKKLSWVFELQEVDFFEAMNRKRPDGAKDVSNYQSLREDYDRVLELFKQSEPKFPFCNTWMAWQMSRRLPKNAVLHLGILNSLRNWGYFEIPAEVCGYSNVGGFGIDGCVSSLVGASLVRPDRPYIGIVGDLAFFYDMNALGNRHIGSNVRLMVINNGMGGEFKLRQTLSTRAGMGEDTDTFIAAAGHYGSKSPELLKHYAQDLGFTYLCARSKAEFLKALDTFLDPKPAGRPMFFEVFTDVNDDSEGVSMLRDLEENLASSAKQTVKGILGENTVRQLKKIIKGK